jgi:hypothetical protein
MFCLLLFKISADWCCQVQVSGSGHHTRLVALSAVAQHNFHMQIGRTLNRGSKLEPVKSLVFILKNIFLNSRASSHTEVRLNYSSPLCLFHNCLWKSELTGATLVSHSSDIFAISIAETPDNHKGCHRWNVGCILYNFRGKLQWKWHPLRFYHLQGPDDWLLNWAMEFDLLS